MEACRLPEMRQARPARNRHAGHVRRFKLVFHPLRQPAEGQALRPGNRRKMAARRPIYRRRRTRSEEHTSELQPLMRISYAVFCLKKKNTTNKRRDTRER